MKKRIIMIALMLVMVMSSFSVPVFADDEYSDPDAYIKDSIKTEEKTPEQEVKKENGVAYPIHDFSYSNLDMEACLYSGDYYYNENAYFKDEARIFDDDSYYKKIEQMIKNTADEHNLNIGVFIGGLYRSDDDTVKFTQNSIKTLFNMDWDQNSVFLYLDFEGRSVSYDYICTCHDAKLYYTDSGLDNRVEDMIQNMYKYLPSSGSKIYKSKVKEAINSFIVDLAVYKKDGAVWDSYYYNEEKDCYRYVLFGNIIDQSFRPFKYWYVFLGIGILLGLIVGAFSNSMIRDKYKFRELQKASVYTSRNLIRFNEVRDQFIREHTTSVYIPPRNSSGGGGGSFGGGGGSFGGGGGHR